jgi:hypothetical protein
MALVGITSRRLRPKAKKRITGISVGPHLRQALAVAVLGVLAASCVSSSPARSSPTSPSTSQSLAANPSPSPAPPPVANKSCVGANPTINTDRAIEALTATQSASSAEHSLQTFLDQYHLKLHVLPFTGSDSSVSFDSLNDDDLTVLVDFGRLLICEYAKYSEQWVNSSGLTSIALVKNLKTNATDKPCTHPGFASLATLTIYHSAECITGYPGQLNIQLRKHSFHHEFWHVMAFSVDKYQDPAWLALNDPGFTYGSSWDPVKGWTPGIRSFHPRDGFVTAYAMFTMQEDEAETYAYMFLPEEYRDLVEWMAADPILKRKVDYLKEFIISRDPGMSEYFKIADQS